MKLSSHRILLQKKVKTYFKNVRKMAMKINLRQDMRERLFFDVATSASEKESANLPE